MCVRLSIELKRIHSSQQGMWRLGWFMFSANHKIEFLSPRSRHTHKALGRDSVSYTECLKRVRLETPVPQRISYRTRFLVSYDIVASSLPHLGFLGSKWPRQGTK